ncbi:unnamed protein product [Didymodactylos carnosus]|uniref:Uncharacterized protein n=1 Tax=Didymodactylos carnosus TaxID=1234261 RepID=A0A815D7M2_9BILA|nr:unnamed protein product [Didymodactylos carnosus]CAF4115426.1 unnamed protein product [Didymodactylos carnosus]
MSTSIPDESSTSEDNESNQMIDHIDESSDEDNDSSPRKRKKLEEIKWKRQKFNSVDLPESHLNPILYFANPSRKTPRIVFDYFVDGT